QTPPDINRVKASERTMVLVELLRHDRAGIALTSPALGEHGKGLPRLSPSPRPSPQGSATARPSPHLRRRSRLRAALLRGASAGSCGTGESRGERSRRAGGAAGAEAKKGFWHSYPPALGTPL